MALELFFGCRDLINLVSSYLDGSRSELNAEFHQKFIISHIANKGECLMTFHERAAMPQYIWLGNTRNVIYNFKKFEYYTLQDNNEWTPYQHYWTRL